jgi:hypothetical protein
MGHGPVGWHLLGTRQSDYIQQLTLHNELPAPPGEVASRAYAWWMGMCFAGSSLFFSKVLYNLSKPVRVDMEKVTVEHPDTKEEVFLFKPMGIHKDSFNDLFAYTVVQAPQLEYTRIESLMASKLLSYNDEMDFWLKYGKDSEQILGRPFYFFNPTLALTTNAEDPERFNPLTKNQL